MLELRGHINLYPTDKMMAETKNIAIILLKLLQLLVVALDFPTMFPA